MRKGSRHSDKTLRKISESHKGIAPWNKGLKRETLPPNVFRKGNVPWNKGLKGCSWNTGMKMPPLSDETKRKISESLKGHPSWSKGKKNIGVSAARKGQIPWNKDKTCPSIGAGKRGKLAHRIGELAPNWRGGTSFEPYCPKFNNEFKERVRAFFNYTCPECGSPQNGQRLRVHHIHYNKDACCSESVSPLFIALCGSCHSRTNGNRSYWQQHFTEMIMRWYGGRCYLTKEEMRFTGVRGPEVWDRTMRTAPS
jgi:hypothetical protein